MFQDKLLSKLEQNEPELATTQEDEVIKIIYETYRYSINA